MEEKIYTIDYILENNIDKTAYGFIYITTNMINGKKYIGQKKFESFKHRTRWKKYLGSGTILKKAIQRYGKENFNRDIVAILHTKEDLDNLEIEFIQLHNAVNRNDYYNISSGGHIGDNFTGKTEEWRNEFRRKISIANTGREKSEETRKRISESNKGRIHSKESKQKMSVSSKGKLKSKESRKHMSENHADFTGKNNPSARKIVCITTNEKFDYIRKASDKYNCDNSNIIKCCKGKIKYCGKLEDGTSLTWMYYEEYLKLYVM